jgi:hypothetical protein
MSSGSGPAGPALGHDSVRGGRGVQVRAVRNGALGHPAVIWAGDTVNEKQKNHKPLSALILVTTTSSSLLMLTTLLLLLRGGEVGGGCGF